MKNTEFLEIAKGKILDYFNSDLFPIMKMYDNDIIYRDNLVKEIKDTQSLKDAKRICDLLMKRYATAGTVVFVSATDQKAVTKLLYEDFFNIFHECGLLYLMPDFNNVYLESFFLWLSNCVAIFNLIITYELNKEKDESEEKLETELEESSNMDVNILSSPKEITSIKDTDKLSIHTDFLYNESLACICSECYTITGSVEVKSAYFSQIFSKDINLKSIQPAIPFVSDFYHECLRCGKTTNHFVVDDAIGMIISELNQRGIKTYFCCSGHAVHGFRNTDEPYILFDSYQMDKFDMTNPVLRYWKLDDPEIFMKENRVALRLKEDCPLSYFKKGKYLNDLYNYIIECIPEQ